MNICAIKDKIFCWVANNIFIKTLIVLIKFPCPHLTKRNHQFISKLLTTSSDKMRFLRIYTTTGKMSTASFLSIFFWVCWPKPEICNSFCTFPDTFTSGFRFPGLSNLSCGAADIVNICPSPFKLFRPSFPLCLALSSLACRNSQCQGHPGRYGRTRPWKGGRLTPPCLGTLPGFPSATLP